MTVAAILARFPSMRALVIGDVCLDRWCRYHPGLAEPSRETAIPRVAVTSTEVTPGAAGTVAANLAALGVGNVSVLGVIGDDGFGWELQRSLAARSISTDLLIRSPLVSTFTYTKLLNASTGAEDLPRLDFINAAPLDSQLESQVIDSLREKIRDFDVILVSDQAETSAGGVVTAKVREALADLGYFGTATVRERQRWNRTATVRERQRWNRTATVRERQRRNRTATVRERQRRNRTATVRERQPTDDATGDRNKVIFVDSRARAELFRNVVLKVNRDEADAACQRIGGDYRALREHTRSKILVITRGSGGALVIGGNNDNANYETTLPARRIHHPVDVCGAGDSFSAGAAMALAVTGSPLEAAQFGNLVASVTIMKKGTGTATPAELLAAAVNEAHP